MKRIYLPLLPLPVLAAIVAASACSKERTEETTHVIPPAVALLASPAQAKAPEIPPPAAPADEAAPTADDLREFGRRVPK